MPPISSRSLDLSELSNWDDIEDAIDNGLLSLSKPHSLGKRKGTGVTEVAGPFISYYALGLGKTVGVFIGHQNHSLWTHLSEGKFFRY